jgi:hypothetical protein
MKKLCLFCAVVISLVSIGCSQPARNKAPASQKGDVEVYYFHLTTRCVTCKAVEAGARNNLQLLYPEQIKSGKISFTALNLEDNIGKAFGERLGVNSQTLLIVKGDQKINITNEGFLYALSQPEKYREIIKSKIDPLIEK